jgi:hypothetical protein
MSLHRFFILFISSILLESVWTAPLPCKPGKKPAVCDRVPKILYPYCDGTWTWPRRSVEVEETCESFAKREAYGIGLPGAGLPHEYPGALHKRSEWTTEGLEDDDEPSQHDSSFTAEAEPKDQEPSVIKPLPYYSVSMSSLSQLLPDKNDLPEASQTVQFSQFGDDIPKEVSSKDSSNGPSWTPFPANIVIGLGVLAKDLLVSIYSILVGQVVMACPAHMTAVSGQAF